MPLDIQRSHCLLLKLCCSLQIHDYPAYGTVAGVVTKGYNGCACCGPNNITQRSLDLKKNIWDHQHGRFLPAVHWMRDDETLFRGNTEHRPPMPQMSGSSTREFGEERDAYIHNGGVASAPTDPVRCHGVKRLSALFSLPYWQVSI